MADEMTTFDPAADGAPADVAPATAAPDPNLADAAETLAGQMEKPGSTPAPKPVTASPPVETKPTGPSPRQEGYRRFQEGAKGRFQREKRELAERRQRQAEMEAQLQKSNALLEKQLEVVRGLRPPDKEEKPPDFMLDPEGFAAWSMGKTEAAIQAAIKPIREAEERRQAQLDAIYQEREQAAQVEQATNQLIEQYQAWADEYAREAPELAAGFDDRFHTMRDTVFAAGFQAAGYTPEEAAERTNLWFHAICQGAAAEGKQPTAVLDAFLAGVAAQFGYEPIGMDEDGGNGNGGGHHQPSRPRTETERLASVQRRAAPAASAAPRVASRVQQLRSELVELRRGGVTDIKALRAAALRDAHGDMAAASIALAQLAGQV